MLNHARLLTQIARDRELFGGDPPLTAEALGEWIVLKDKWPSLARLIERDPEVLGRLEEQAAQQEEEPPYDFSVNGKVLDLKEPELLHTLLRTAPALGAVAERLVHFEAAPKPPSPA